MVRGTAESDPLTFRRKSVRTIDNTAQIEPRCGLCGANNRPILTPYAAAHVSRRACRTSLTSARLGSRMEGTFMAIALTLQKYLDQNVTYEVIPHDPTLSSMRTAEACHISGDGLAKGIVLRRDEGYMLAVLPASHHIRLSELRGQIGNDV